MQFVGHEAAAPCQGPGLLSELLLLSQERLGVPDGLVALVAQSGLQVGETGQEGLAVEAQRLELLARSGGAAERLSAPVNPARSSMAAVSAVSRAFRSRSVTSRASPPLRCCCFWTSAICACEVRAAVAGG